MHDKLFIPGPSEVRPELLQAVATPQIGHRTQKYKDLHAALIPHAARRSSTPNRT